MLTFVLKGVFKGDEFAPFFIPLRLIKVKWFGNYVNLTASLDDIIDLGDMSDSVINLVIFTIFDTNLSKERQDCTFHSFLRVYLNFIQAFFAQHVFNLKEHHVVFIWLGLCRILSFALFKVDSLFLWDKRLVFILPIRQLSQGILGLLLLLDTSLGLLLFSSSFFLSKF